MRRLALGREPCAVSAILHANDPFRRYKPEPTHEVRKPGITGQSFIEQARRTRQMLKEMDPEVAKQQIEFHRDLDLFEAFALAKREGELIVPNIVHDKILIRTTGWRYSDQNYPVWTGTLIIYEKPDTPFEDKVVFIRKNLFKQDNVYSISFKVPDQFQGKPNCALAIEHPDFDLIELGKNKYEIKLVEGADVHLIENFPKEHSWHMPHAETGIPQGEPVEGAYKVRYLWRTSYSYIGPLVRGFVDIFGGRPGVVAKEHDVFDRFGMAVVSIGRPEERSSPDCCVAQQLVSCRNATSLLGGREVRSISRDLSVGQTDRDRRSLDDAPALKND
ncbi:hypothetical protein J4450_00580 [Candidatus Micrarchaeota archaeon]|nr:hypothetical protein [Candidatus Micrarchaeota archaeon]